MPERLFHGTNGDRILSIISEGHMVPDSDGCLFFSKYDWRNTFMHGADTKRKAAYAIAVDVVLPTGASMMPVSSTHGVRDTCKVISPVPVPVAVVTLFVREPRQSEVFQIHGVAAITEYLNSRAATF